jgi:hypothetical protein
VLKAQTTEEQEEMIADGGQLLRRVEVFVNTQQAPTGALKLRYCVDTKYKGIVRILFDTARGTEWEKRVIPKGHVQFERICALVGPGEESS